MKSTLLFLTLLTCAQAAVLTGTVAPAPNNSKDTDYALPGGAGTDWGYFSPGSSNSTEGGTVNASNTSSTGPRTFGVSAVTTATSGNTRRVRGSTTAVDAFFSYENGTTTSSASDVQFNGIFNAVTGSAGVNSGVQMTLSGFTANEPTTILLWVFNYQAAGQLTALVNDQENEFDPVTINNITTAGKFSTLFTFTFTPDATTDTVNFQYVMTSSADGSSNVGFVAVAIIPEPGSIALLSIAAASVGFRRRR